ncbi:MAG: hypothetical protein ACYDC9_00490 [Dermatophilaceae bacterium]
MSTTQNTCVAEAYGSQVTTWATQGCEGLDAGGGPRTGGPYIHLHLTRLITPACDLTGEQVTSRPDLVVAKLTGRLTPANAHQLDEIAALYDAVREHPTTPIVPATRAPGWRPTSGASPSSRRGGRRTDGSRDKPAAGSGRRWWACSRPSCRSAGAPST